MIVDCGLYCDGKRSDETLSLGEAYDRAGGSDSVVRVGLHDPSPEEFDDVTRGFHLHELAVEDAIKARQRSKLEIHGDSLFVVLKPARYDGDAEEIALVDIMLAVGERFGVTVRHGELAPLGSVRERLENDPALLARGPTAVRYAVLDRVVDDYLPIATDLDRDVEQVAEDVFSADGGNPTASTGSSARCWRFIARPLG
jgi:magnesium transporter